jgi:regulator of G-protein signaling
VASDTSLVVTSSAIGGSAGLGGERGVDVGRVGSWATDFERLLADPVGLQTFAVSKSHFTCVHTYQNNILWLLRTDIFLKEFLKKEFSAENIVFWVSCERFRRRAPKATSTELNAEAAAIMERHLAQGAPDPVNVDSHARQAAQDGMANPSASVFAPAQKQIYNLMKFDSFSRFLKSDLYKDSLMAEMSGKALPFADALDPEVMVEEVTIPRSSSAIVDGSASAATTKKPEENRRRSLLPWANLKGNKDRAKSKERPTNSLADSADSKKRKGNKDSRASLASVDSQIEVSGMATRDSMSAIGDDPSSSCTLARVILPDKATTVVQTRKGETIRAMVSRLLEKRGLRLTSFDVFATTSPSDPSDSRLSQPQQQRPLDLGEDSSTLGCTEVRVEPRVLFRLELPSGKSIGVKAKPAKVARDVLGPILNQYGWDLSSVCVRREREGRVIDLDSTVASIDNTRLVVVTMERAENGSLKSTSSRESASGTEKRVSSYCIVRVAQNSSVCTVSVDIHFALALSNFVQ